MRYTKIVAMTLAAALLVVSVTANSYAATWDGTDDSKLTNTYYATWNGFVDATYPTVTTSTVSWANTFRNNMGVDYYGTVQTASSYASYQNDATARISPNDYANKDVSYSSGSSGNHEIQVTHYYGLQSGVKSISTNGPQYSSQSFYKS